MLKNMCETVEKNTNNFICPDYQKNCISNIPQLVTQALKANKTPQKTTFEDNIEETDCEEPTNVVLIVIDGFGFNQFQKHYKKDKFLTRLTQKGDVFPLTSTFPSQTTNALTTLNTGLTPQEHGLFEFFIYLKNVGVVNTLSFERTGCKQSNLSIEGFDPLLFKGKTIHTQLKEQEIDCYAHMNAYNAFNACSKLLFEGATIVPGLKLSDTVVGLRKKIEKNKDKKSYYFVHLDSLDTIAHEYGPDSYEAHAELSLITHVLNKELVQKIDKKTAKKTLLLVTADHGGLNVNPTQTTYLNFNNYTVPNLKTDKTHKTITPTGSLREIFLHIKEEKIGQTKELLEQKIGGKAQIVETKEMAKSGFFGVGATSEEFFERAGNLMMLPYANETIWFENSEGRRVNFLGQHGGLSEEEMLVPFATTNLAALKSS
jgi:predicted AlkP superfamily pyrophosphatase or phosphodiesterase